MRLGTGPNQSLQVSTTISCIIALEPIIVINVFNPIPPELFEGGAAWGGGGGGN